MNLNQLFLLAEHHHMLPRQCSYRALPFKGENSGLAFYLRLTHLMQLFDRNERILGLVLNKDKSATGF